MIAAVLGLKRRHPRSITVASPVASLQAVHALEAEGVQVRTLRTPEPFGAVGYYYEDFSQLSDAEVGAFFRISATEISTGPHTIPLQALVGSPEHSIGTVIFAHGSGSGRLSPRNQYVADFLNRRGITTVLVDLLTVAEHRDRANVFDLNLLSERMLAVTRWAAKEVAAGGSPIGYFGASTGSAAALRAASRLPSRISAIVSRGGRPDLAAAALAKVKAPTLLIVGDADTEVLRLNRQALAKIKAPKRLELISGATHLFEEPGALEQVAEHAAAWFESHFLALSPEVQASSLRHESRT
jgi:putative phosphoribosyl transferase